MSLDSFQSTDTKVTARLAFDKSQTGGGSYVAVIGRRVSSSNDYRLKLRAQSSGAVTAQLVRIVGGAETVLQSVATVPGLNWSAGQYVKVRLEAEGTSPTALRARIWADAASEPTTWTLQATDSTSALQTGGGIGFWDYLSGSATNAPITLLVDDLLATPVAGGTTPPTNTAPTASFTTSCSVLTCSVDASSSTDADGTIVSYAWEFGDGGSGSGVTSSRTYAAAGTYTVTLTVTDGDGATSSTTRQVAPSSTPSPFIASDAFSRTITGGWGTADVGGAWSPASAATSFAVAGGTGNVSMSAGSGRNVHLSGVTPSSTDMVFTMSVDKAVTGGGLYVSPIGRRVVGVGEYRAKIRLLSNGQVHLTLVRTNSTGAETTIRQQVTVAGLTVMAGTQVRVRLQVTGAGPTTVRARVWAVGTAEPTAWAASVTDATAGMQVGGSVGFNTYLSGSATNAPLTVRFDDVGVVPAA